MFNYLHYNLLVKKTIYLLSFCFILSIMDVWLIGFSKMSGSFTSI